MPNYCENVLEIRGERGEVESFLESVRGEDDGEETPLDFNSIMPYPDEYRRADEVAEAWDEEWTRRGRPMGEWKDRPADGFGSGGREWRVANWGTKWNAIVHGIGEFKRRAVRIEFCTGWSPPIPWVLAASRRFPTLTFSLRYWEGGNCFKGHFVAHDGEALKHESSDYFGNRGG